MEFLYFAVFAYLLWYVGSTLASIAVALDEIAKIIKEEKKDGGSNV